MTPPVLMVFTSTLVAGSEVGSAMLVEELTRRGVTCHALVPARSPLEARMRAAGARTLAWPAALAPMVVRRPGAGGLGRTLGRATGLAGAVPARRWVAATQRELGAVLHLTNLRPAFVAGDPERGLADLCDLLAEPFFSASMARRAGARLAAGARSVVANSQAMADSLLATGFPPERLEVAFPPLDLARFHPLDAGRRAAVRRAEGWPVDAPLLAWAGRLAGWKAPHLAIEALARLGPDAHLVVAGEAAFDHPAYARSLPRRAVELGVAGRVHFAGFRADIEHVLGAADAVLHTSVQPEPLGRTLMEAQALGVPVVAADGGGTGELVEHGVTGWRYPIGDLEGLVEGIGWALAVDRAAVARAGVARARADFDLAAAGRAYLERYRRLAAG